jgi:hypothetical protein
MGPLGPISPIPATPSVLLAAQVTGHAPQLRIEDENENESVNGEPDGELRTANREPGSLLQHLVNTRPEPGRRPEGQLIASREQHLARFVVGLERQH